MPPAADGGPLLVLVHGTFVDTVGTFGKLWTQHPRRVRQLFARYGDRVYALDHPTLGASPIANALTLVRALPAGARAAPGHALARRPGRRGAGARLRRPAARATTTSTLFAGDDYAQHRADLARAREGGAGQGA